MPKLTKTVRLLIPLVVFFSILTAIKVYSNEPIAGLDNINSQIAGTKTFNFGPETDLNLPTSATPSAFLDNLTAQSVYIYDLSDKKALFSKNSTDKAPVASTLKILTAAVVLDNAPLESIFTVSEKAANVGEDSMFLSSGEKLTVEELLYGLMLPSGNDAAITLAEGVAGSEADFVEIMNQKAAKIGLDNSFFVNSSGLQDDGDDYSTARDITQLAAYAWQNYPLLRKIAGTYNHVIPESPNHKTFDLYNETNLLTTYPGIKGFKTGFTYKAGYCLITVAEINGHDIIISLLNSQNRREEMRQILDNLQNIIQ